MLKKISVSYLDMSIDFDAKKNLLEIQTPFLKRNIEFLTDFFFPLHLEVFDTELTKKKKITVPNSNPSSDGTDILANPLPFPHPATVALSPTSF